MRRYTNTSSVLAQHGKLTKAVLQGPIVAGEYHVSACGAAAPIVHCPAIAASPTWRIAMIEMLRVKEGSEWYWQLSVSLH